MNLDPLALLSRAQSDDLGNSWYNGQLHYVAGYGARKTQMEATRNLLLQRDWGSAEEPGPSLWVLRGLFGSMFKGGYRAAWIADALEGQGPVPPHVAHVFTHAWKRQRSLCDISVGATMKPEGDDARLLKALLESMPDLFRWACLLPEGLKGPRPEHMVVADFPGSEYEPPRSSQQFTGNPYTSFMADLVKPKYNIAPWILESVLALDPFAGYPAETRERSLVEIATHYRSEPLKKYAVQIMEAEGRLESQGVDVRDRTWPVLMLRKRRFEELKTSGVDIHHVDENGHTYFHHLAASWVPVGFRDGQSYVKEPSEMEHDFENILAGWRTLVEMGADPDAPCTPPQKLRYSKSPNRKGIPIGWRQNQVLPGETALASLQRRAQAQPEGKSTPLSIDLVNRLVACLREDRARTMGETALNPDRVQRPQRARQRS